jgi:peptidyl-prolyl cis-trans isomerase D
VASVLSLPYSTLDDAKFKVTDADITKYIKENQNKFKQEASRTLDLVVFDIIPTSEDSLERKNKLEDLRNTYLAITDKSKDTAFIERNSIQRDQVNFFSKSDVERSGRDAEVIFNTSVGTTTNIYIADGNYVFTKIIDRTFAPDSVRAAHILLSLGNRTEAEIADANRKADSIIALAYTGQVRFGDLANQNSLDEASKVKGGDLGYFPRNQMVKEFNDQVFYKNMLPGQLAKVESQFGLHIILLLDTRNPEIVTKFADFVEPIRPSKATESVAYGVATAFFQKNNTAPKFDTAAKSEKLIPNAIVTANSYSIQNLGSAREIVRWAFDEKEGKPNSIKYFDMSDKFVVAKINKVTAKGVAQVADVKDEVNTLLINKKKAEQLADELNKVAAGKTGLTDIAASLKDATVNDSIKVTLTSGFTPFGNEPKIAGAVFGTPEGKISKPIKGNEGVYMVQPGAVQKESALLSNPETLGAYQKQMQQMENQRISYQSIIQSIIEKADIQDKRFTYF